MKPSIKLLLFIVGIVTIIYGSFIVGLYVAEHINFDVVGTIFLCITFTCAFLCIYSYKKAVDSANK